ncbi:hypothetical protein EYF80_026062 [Liparis tanakae]|uniref:Uncharacterized protein n=1 Tax=Liparis tanakae TaxID=230148 RepID=A0A4Z2HEM7_9TELE|nr:hypothetical protein EYF80_026062 [Liparis tanakae]
MTLFETLRGDRATSSRASPDRLGGAGATPGEDRRSGGQEVRSCHSLSSSSVASDPASTSALLKTFLNTLRCSSRPLFSLITSTCSLASTSLGGAASLPLEVSLDLSSSRSTFSLSSSTVPQIAAVSSVLRTPPLGVEEQLALAGRNSIAAPPHVNGEPVVREKMGRGGGGGGGLEPQLLLQSWDGVGLLILDGPLQELQHLLPQQQLQHVAVSYGVRQQRPEGGRQVVHLPQQLPVRLLQGGDLCHGDLHRAAQPVQAVIQSRGPVALRGHRLLHLQDGGEGRERESFKYSAI